MMSYAGYSLPGFKSYTFQDAVRRCGSFASPHTFVLSGEHMLSKPVLLKIWICLRGSVFERGTRGIRLEQPLRE